MLLEHFYLFYIYILFFYLILVTVISVTLFVALVVTMNRLNKQKNTSLLGR